jgi:hypothetical protein
MFGLERLKRYIWYIKRVRYLNSYWKYAVINLAYFQSVRNNNLMRQQIGLQDLNVTNLPRVNPKKKKMMMGNSESVMNGILVDLPKEYEKLRRWRNINYVSNKYPTGKVIFDNEQFELSIR